MVINLGAQNSLLNVFISEMRDVEIQKDSLRFRRNMERLGEIFAYEISKTEIYEEKEIITPLGVAPMNLPSKQPVLATILRAGLPFHQGMLNFFDRAENSFITAYRKHHKDGSFTIQVEHASCPDIEGKTLILCDPMLATGSSIVMTYKRLLEFGTPAKLHIATIIASAQGVEYIKANLPQRTTKVWAAAIDEELTAHAYIVPGLGDAGDLAFGSKE